MADRERLHRLAGELARVRAVARRRQRWLAATAEVVSAVVALPDRDAALAFVARRAREVAGAALVMVLLHDEATVKLTVATVDAEERLDGLAGVEVLRAGTIFDTALRDQRPVALDDLRAAAPWPVELPPLRAAMAPFGGIRGVLVVAYDGAARDEDEATLLSLFAGQAAITLDREEARADREAVLVLSERERIARDLHDVVIQRLFGIGLSMQTATSIALHPEVRTRTRQAVEDLDATIRAIRGAIFELRGAPTDSVRAELQTVVDQACANLGFRPSLRIDGPVDTAVPAEVSGDLLAVVVEALSNVVRHSAATEAEVHVSAGVDRVTAVVTDNGRGGAVTVSGLANLQLRAAQRNGDFTIVSPPGDGTKLVWSVPL
jgi:signal transduction histidine kinase